MTENEDKSNAKHKNIKIYIHGFRFIEIETGYVAKPNRTAINREPLSALICICIYIYVYINIQMMIKTQTHKHDKYTNDDKNTDTRLRPTATYGQILLMNTVCRS